MSDLFKWLAASAVTILALFLTWWALKYAFQWAGAGPKGVLLLIVSTIMTLLASRYLLVPVVDDTYRGIKGGVRDSTIAADVVSVLGAAPSNLGLTGQGSSIIQNPAQGNPFGQSQPTTSGSIVSSPVTTTDPTVMAFDPKSVTLAGGYLGLEYPNGELKVLSASEVVNPTACGIDLRRLDTSGKPTHLLACPASDGVEFAIAQVILPADFPQPPSVAITTPERGGGEPVTSLFSKPGFGACLLAQLAGKGIAQSTQFGSNWLPAGSVWTLTSPNWWGRAFTLAANEQWTLVSKDWQGVSLTINGVLAHQMGGRTGAGPTSVSIIGTGPVPPECK